MRLPKNLMKLNRWLFAPASIVVLLAGCEGQHFQTAEERDPFPSEGDTRSYRRFVIAQEAASARLDGTLYDYHFEGTSVNSLGEHRLDLMLKDNSIAWPIVVHFDTTDEALVKARQASVSAYLRDAGLLESQMRFETGPNTKVTSAAAPNLSRMYKTEDGAGGGGAGGGGGAAGGAPAADAGGAK